MATWTRRTTENITTHNGEIPMGTRVQRGGSPAPGLVIVRVEGRGDVTMTTVESERVTEQITEHDDHGAAAERAVSATLRQSGRAY